MDEEISYESYELGELQEVIGLMEDNPPKDKRSKAYKEYVRVINSLFELYNIKSKNKTYILIK